MKSLLIIGISLLINFTSLAQNAEVANENDKNKEFFHQKIRIICSIGITSKFCKWT